ncbi:MAG: riboflavin kinase [Phycisphaerae bacterium]|nr:riboflavin kinase [Phycisphaerae bacterium]
MVEVHLLDAEGDFYGKDISVTFLGRIRDQQKFSDTDALKTQIAKDVQSVRKMCK